ncbi:hypothetical protein ACFE04_000925 [Oxalis oulophora]
MAESKKGTSSVAPKKKDSFLDDEIGMGFGSSWKAHDDAMDFGFDTGTTINGKKNKFNFDNLDMDFNMDGAFGKLSSFDVDMPDLDFDKPAKKSVKPKGRSEPESSEENNRLKKDHFNFSFDFNDEMGSFNIDSSPPKADKSSQKNFEKRGSAASDTDDGQGSKTQQVENSITVKVNATAKHQSSENKDTSNPVGGLGACSSIDDIFLSDCTISGNLSLPNRDKTSDTDDVQGSKTQQVEDATTVIVNATAKHQSSENKDTSNPVGGLGACSSIDDTFLSDCTISKNLCLANRDKISNEKKVPKTEEKTGLQHTLPEKELSTDLSKQIMQNIAAQSVANEYTKDTDSNIKTDECPPNQDLKSTSDKEESKDDMFFGPIDVEDSESKDSSSLSVAKSESKKSESKLLDNKAPLKNDVEVSSTSRLINSTLNNKTSIKDVSTSTTKLLLPSASEPLTHKLTLMKEKEGDNIHSDIFQQTEETRHQLSQPLSAGAEDTPFEKRRLVHLNSFSANDESEKFKSDDVKRARTLVSASKPRDREGTREDSVVEASEKSTKENFISYDGQRGTKLSADSRNDEEVIKENYVSGGGEKSTKLQVNLTSLTGLTSKSSSQKIVNPRPSMSSLVSTLKSKSVSAEGLKTGKGVPESSLRNFRVMKANTDLLNSTLQKGSSKILDQKMEKTEQTLSRIVHPADNSRKHTPPMLSLKRKTSEEPKADLEPSKILKRLSESPKESRNFKGTSPNIVEEQVPVRNHEIKCTTKSVQYEHQTPKLPITREVDMVQVGNHENKSNTQSVQYEHQSLKLQFTQKVDKAQVENNGTVERAEAYTKGLEDICNMLKKKHEEAKELMVRAVSIFPLALTLNNCELRVNREELGGNCIEQLLTIQQLELNSVFRQRLTVKITSMELSD